MMVKKQNIKDTNLRRHKGNKKDYRCLLMLLTGELKKEVNKSYEVVKCDFLKDFQEYHRQ